MATSGLLALSTDECRRLLTTEQIGRVVLSINAMPSALPVSYRLVGDDIVFRTSEGSKLSAALRRTVVAFEVDQIDLDSGSGWSVLVVGESRVISDSAEVAQLELAGIGSWMPQPPSDYVGIRIGRMTGRRLPLRADSGPDGS